MVHPGRSTARRGSDSAPIVLETLSTGNRQVQGALSIYPVVTGNGTNIRIVAGKNGPTQAFSVYTLD